MDINSLFQDARTGRRESEDQLFRALRDSFRLFVQLRFRNADDCEDIVQNALVTVAKKYRTIDIHTSFAAWAWKIMNNKILDYIKVERQRQKRTHSYDEAGQEKTTADHDPTLRRRMLDCLRQVGRANDQFARVLNLHYQGYGTSEICSRLQLKSSYFYVVLSRARLMLQRCLQKDED